MRLLSLDLDRYGPFTGHRLAFRPDARLHVVLGPNEAGKSCALAAVTDLLFGTRDTRYEFLHRESGLRLGAEISARDGRTLAFFRRRGGKSTLSDPQAKTLPDDALAPFLGGLSRPVFCNAFGMNADVLRKGALEMLQSEGEVGKTLMAAASGLRGFRDAATALDKEATDIFTPIARKRRLNDLIKSYEEARAAARDTRIGTETWRKLEAGLAEAETQLAGIGERRKAIASETSRLKRLKATLPILAVLDELATEAGRFADLPEMDDAAVEDFALKVRRAGATTEASSMADDALATAEADLACVPGDDAVAPHGEAIEALVKETGAYEKAMADLPRVRSAADGLERDLAAVAVRLGLADATAVEGRQPTDLARAHLKDLIASGREILAERVRQERELLRLRADLAALVKSHGERRAPADPGPLQALYDAIQPALAQIDRRDALLDETRRDAAALAGAARRLQPPLGSPDDMTRLALPSGETLRRQGDAMTEASRHRASTSERLAQAGRAAEDVLRRMNARDAGRDLPHPDILARTRRERDESWVAVRSAAFGEAGAPAGAELLRRATAFERAATDADALADRLIRDATRAAEQAADQRRVAELSEDVAAARSELAAAEAAEASARAEWLALWAPLTVAPLPPSEMAEWRSAVLALVARAEALAQRQAEADRLANGVESVRPQLGTLADRLGLQEVAGLDAALVAGRVVERLRALAQAWDAARDAATRIATAEEAIASGEAALRAGAGREEDWRRGWSDALHALVLPPETSLGAAAAALEAWGEVPVLVRERADRLKRVAGMARDAEGYEAEVRRIARVVAMTDPETGPVETVRLLRERSQRAREAAVLRGTRAEALRTAERMRDAARLAAERAGAALAELTTRHGVPATADPAMLVSRLGDRSKLREKIRSARAELARASEGFAEAALRAELAAIQVGEIEGRLTDLASEGERLDHDSNVAFARREALQADRSRIEGGSGS